MAKLLIGGDLYLGSSKKQPIIGDLLSALMSSAGFRILNLEGPILDHPCYPPLPKSGPAIYQNKKNVEILLKDLQVDMVTLANNHLLDFGDAGLIETLQNLNNTGNKYVGAGKDLREAVKTRTIELDDKQIAILNIAENEWASATVGRGGAHPLNVIENAQAIRKAKETSDLVIVLLHAGVEYLEHPTPDVRKLCKHYAACGASLIVGHHPHVVQGHELINGTMIYYSLGNFIFDSSALSASTSNGALLEVELSDDMPLITTLHPLEFDSKTETWDLVAGIAKEKLLHRNEELSRILVKPEEYKAVWEAFIEDESRRYLTYLSPFRYIKNRMLRGFINRVLKYRPGNKSYYGTLLNLIRAESHREVLMQVLERELKK